MAVSGTISTTTFNTNRVIDHAFRRCRIVPQRVTPEMQQVGEDLLYLLLSEIASVKTPSWCIEKLILPFYEGQPDVVLPNGTELVLNANYRYLQPVTGSNVTSSTVYQVNFPTSTIVSTVGIKWSATAVPVSFSVSNDGATWTVVDTVTPTASAGEITWYDVYPAVAYPYFKITALSGTLNYSTITLGNTPAEVPFGVLNRDSYVAQSNQIFAGRPTTYWFQRDRDNPVMHLWPAPNIAAEAAQLIVWRQRQIMDVGTLQQELDIPQRWYNAIVDKLASLLALEIDIVDPNLITVLAQSSAFSMNVAWTGDNDGSSTTIAPTIGYYTK